jgi:Leucine-rich repeat (LRR) protein
MQPLFLFFVLFLHNPLCKAFQCSSSPSDADKIIACNYVKIPDLEKCFTTKELEVYHFDVPIPAQIGVLTNLNSLSIWNSGGGGGGPIPSSIGCLTKLTYLNFSPSDLKGTIPSSIGLLTELVYLNFYENHLQGSIPSHIGLLKKLKTLTLSANELTGSIPSSLGSLTGLNRLTLSGNKLTGSIPSSIGKMTLLINRIAYLEFGL